MPVQAQPRGPIQATATPLIQGRVDGASVDLVSDHPISTQSVAEIAIQKEGQTSPSIGHQSSQNIKSEPAITVLQTNIAASAVSVEIPPTKLPILELPSSVQEKSAPVQPGAHKPIYIVPRPRRQGRPLPTTVAPRNAFISVTQTEQNSLRTSLLNRSAQFRMVWHTIVYSLLMRSQIAANVARSIEWNRDNSAAAIAAIDRYPSCPAPIDSSTAADATTC